MATMNQEKMVEELSSWTVIEVANLITALETKWGVKAAPAAVAMAAGPAAPVAAVVEQTEFTVELTAAGAKKIEVIKVVRELTGLGLADAKNLVEAAPKTVKESVAKAEAEEMKKKLTDAGATVTLK
jgi:large subunit ribosomal protein L7/L12